jgi:hypothetical protein
MDGDALLTLSLMARRLRVPVKWLRSEAQAGRIPALDAGGRFLFHAPSVERALLSRAVGELTGAGAGIQGVKDAR